MKSSNEQIIEGLLQYENLSSLEIANRTPLSQPTVSRALANLPVIKIGAGRSSAFALLKDTNPISLYEVDEFGRINLLGELYRQPNNRSILVQGKRFITYEGLPFYFYDSLPSGFLGSISLAQIIKHDTLLTTKSQDWNDDQVIHYLSHYGDDFSGARIASEKMAEQAANKTYQKNERANYSAIAEQIAQSSNNISSLVVGEQPKFTVFNGKNHLIVKYSPKIKETNALAIRHKDLLICEHIALNTLAKHGIEAAQSSLHIDDHVYLEINRFDRVGKYGRIDTISLRALDSEYAGKNGTWIDIGKELLRNKMISQVDFFTIEAAYAFGVYIANNDMHNGNFSFFMMKLELEGPTPVYDMLPMAFMPSQGELRDPDLEAPRFVNASPEANKQGLIMALEFWDRVNNHSVVSEEFKRTTHSYSQALKNRPVI